MVVKIVCDNGDKEYYESSSVVYKKEEEALFINNGHKINLIRDNIRSVFVNGEMVYVSKKVYEEVKKHLNNLPTNGLSITGDLLGVRESVINVH